MTVDARHPIIMTGAAHPGSGSFSCSPAVVAAAITAVATAQDSTIFSAAMTATVLSS